MPRVYIETTIPSYYFETRRAPSVIAWREATRRWWDAYAAAYDLVTSDVVLRELGRAPLGKASRMLRLLDGLDLLEMSVQVEEVVAF